MVMQMANVLKGKLKGDTGIWGQKIVCCKVISHESFKSMLGEKKKKITWVIPNYLKCMS